MASPKRSARIAKRSPSSPYSTVQSQQLGAATRSSSAAGSVSRRKEEKKRGEGRSEGFHVAATEPHSLEGIPTGSGASHQDPIRIPCRESPNDSGCVYCPIGVELCDCVEFKEIIWGKLLAVDNKRRVCGKKAQNSKSILPPFVTRLVRLLGIDASDVFWDLGSGHGSVVMQVACQTGATAIGVELQQENADLANAVWPAVKREWERRHPDRKAGHVVFIGGDMFPTLAAAIDGSLAGISPPTVAWAANLVFPPMLNHHLREALLTVPSLKAVGVQLDIYPHSRESARKRDPRPFEKFPRMIYHEWQEGSVEWSETEVKVFCTYTSRK